MSELLKIFEFTTREVRDLAREQSVADAPVTVDGVTIIPISSVSCGFSCGGSDLAAKKKADGLMAGAGAKVKRTPETYLAVIDGQVQLLQPPAEPQSSLLDTVRPLIAALRTMRAAKKQTTNE
ncbi:MAG: GerW family sporulation protein [Candidatus Faecousia sp.]|uniref:GerW family sporulation protein n=1 Tax=Faecousia sp. TaxID=2952921 RepID=UPI002A8C6D79|nr:GerW family sporulation protein [Candidatus Faecousia sp.]